MTTPLAAAAALPEPASPLYLEDIAVGDRFTSGEHAMDAAQIQAFAAQFDPQPFHLDDAAGRATLFGGLAASGWHTAAITMRLQVTTGLPIADDGRNEAMDLTEAARNALREMIAYLVAERGLTREAAYALSSATVDLRISEVVDVPNPVVAAVLPLDIFET